MPAALKQVSGRTRTPLVATALVTALILAFALFGSLDGLATATSMIMLTIFALVNLALLRVKAVLGPVPDAPDFPRTVPLLGFVLSTGFVLWELTGRLS